jgi:predicted permease
MSWASVVTARLRGLLTHNRLDRQIDAEIRFHIEMRTEEYLKKGMDPAGARNAALRDFGGVEPMKERYRDRRTLPAVETILQDVRYALRTFLRNPGYAATCIVVLALAIGANTAMFSVLNAVLFRPLPYRAPEQLAVLWTEIPSQNVRAGRSGYRSVEQWRNQSNSFDGMAVSDPVSATLSGAEEAVRVSVLRVSPNYFSLLGVQPLHGRAFTQAEAEQRQRLALVSYRFWQTRFGGAYDALGKTIEIDGAGSQIIGILPPELLGDIDIWEAHTMFPNWQSLREARSGSWFVTARLRNGVSFQQAQTEMNGIARRLDEQLPASERNRGIAVVPLAVHITGPKARLALWLLAGAVLCVLLIAVTNVAGLNLARGAAREREISIRTALGAGRARIVRQLIAESVTLSVLAGFLGLPVAAGALALANTVPPGTVTRLDQASLDPATLACTFGLCLLTGILAGLAPALTLIRRGPSLQQGARGVAGGVAVRGLRRILVVTEVALAIVLLAGASLLIRSLQSVEHVDPGFQPRGILTVGLSTTALRTPLSKVQRADFYQRVLEQVESVPGVSSAAMIGNFFIGGNPEQIVTIEGDSRGVSVRMRLRREEISSGFFQTVGAPLVAGRFFHKTDGALNDNPETPRVAIVNDTMARRLWPGRDPVGKRFKLGAADSRAPWYTVLGVAGDMRRQDLETEPIPQIFEPLVQDPSRLMTLLVRTSLDDPLQLQTSVRAAVQRLDKNALVYGGGTLEAALGSQLSARRMQTSLLTGFSAIALLLAAIGIYGLIRYSVAARTQEIGIRMAIGAQASNIFGMIAAEGFKLSVAGIALGLAAALALGRAASSLLFGIRATDAVTFLAVPLLLLAITAAACYLPARRAMKIDPVVALRQ